MVPKSLSHVRQWRQNRCEVTRISLAEEAKSVFLYEVLAYPVNFTINEPIAANMF